MTVPTYSVEPQYEPKGPGAGWYVAPTDAQASVFCVIREYLGDVSIIASETSRRYAEARIASLNAARRLSEAQPIATQPVKRASMLARFAMGLPFVLAFWGVCAVLANAG